MNESGAAGGVFGRGAMDAARLAPPRTARGLVERRLVLRSLDLARTGRLTLLTGPAGAGKTVCLAQWRERLLARGVKVAWYGAREREREPAAFARLLAAAIHHAGVDLTHTGLPDSIDTQPDTVLDAILLALEGERTDVVLVIDAFERIDCPEINALVQDLIETAPERLHVVLSARRKPRLAVSALRAQGAARAIDTHELRFDRDEIAEALGLAQDSPDLDLIAERTEGWPVAVELLRLWRERAGGADGELTLFNGQSGEIAEYLAEQVFDTLSPEEQALLFDLAILGEASAELADHMRQRTDSGALFDALVAALPGLVESTAGAQDRGYRIHPLLIEYARGRGAPSPTHMGDLRRRAAAWLEGVQRLPEAVAQARAANDPQFLAGLLARIDPLRVFLAAGAGELRAILRELSPAHIAEHPRLRLMEALAAFKAGVFLQGRALLETVRAQTDDFTRDPQGRPSALQAEARALELLFGGYLDGARLDERPLVEAIGRAAPGDTLMAAWCENIVTIILAERGDLAASKEALARCRAIYLSHGMTRFAEFWLLNHHALLALAHGQYRAGAELAGAMRRQRLGDLASDVPVLAMAQITAAVCAYERRFSEEASEALRQGLDLLGSAETWFEPYAVAYPVMAEVAYRRGGLAELAEFIARARARVREQGVGGVEALLDALWAAWMFRAGRGDLAPGGPATPGEDALDRAAEPWRLTDARSVALALGRLASGEPEAARVHARALIAAGRRGDRLRTLVKGHLLEAMAFAAKGEPDAARTAMETALALAAPEQATAVFAEEGARAEALARMVAEDEAAPPATRRQADLVLRASALGRREVSALNEQEARIVGYLRDGASNKLIGRRMGLSENTIKFHMKRIFAKLGVTHRRDAAAAFSRLPALGPDHPG